MGNMSEFERQRQENIERNRALLKQLNLDSLNQSIEKEIPAKRPKNKPTRRNKESSVKKENVEPSRKSRRLAGVNMEDTEEERKFREEQEVKEEKRKELERLKSMRLFGDFKLIDLVTDRSSGVLKFENKILNSQGDTSNKDVKKENDDLEGEPKIEDDNKVLQLLKELGDKFSAGDFYEMIKDSTDSSPDLRAQRDNLEKLTLYEKFNPLDIKITHQRITAMAFHPSTKDRVLAAGDKVGNLGIWAIDSDANEEEPAITILKPHGKSISKIITPFNSPSKIYSSAYDGSIRELDLNKLTSSELLYFSDPSEGPNVPLGISDMNLSPDNPYIINLTTLSGLFLKHDLREKFTAQDNNGILRLHDKKIGGFAVNPNYSHEIATASLDRTLRVWDLRKTAKSFAKWSEIDDYGSASLSQMYSSRLSVSCVDWNNKNRLVCNGYDDTIRVFDLSSKNSKESIVSSQKGEALNAWSDEHAEELVLNDNLQSLTSIKHNCQTGRWVSILKSKWQSSPKDNVEKFVIANMNRGFDIYNQDGLILSHLTHPEVGAVPAVATLHPVENWCVGGSASGKVYLFQ
ncbi:Piso0_004902 [Millerozyma farinosa CBS 7064]|uniref:DNA damage-binding protein CMR1 n=1 Tax=Pichia sorbitophila (strain ATCC MYA-4447 / BCRC 22081 / CBS 7064 / NBRC 10061 / NRRL Y-12695) TaxID=559304 RepID=G8Y3P7_PICSO|nr:Piso0_004902 [Millerozyma farinosa CBS 7064]